MEMDVSVIRDLRKKLEEIEKQNKSVGNSSDIAELKAECDTEVENSSGVSEQVDKLIKEIESNNQIEVNHEAENDDEYSDFKHVVTIWVIFGLMLLCISLVVVLYTNDQSNAPSVKKEQLNKTDIAYETPVSSDNSGLLSAMLDSKIAEINKQTSDYVFYVNGVRGKRRLHYTGGRTIFYQDKKFIIKLHGENDSDVVLKPYSIKAGKRYYKRDKVGKKYHFHIDYKGTEIYYVALDDYQSKVILHLRWDNVWMRCRVSKKQIGVVEEFIDNARLIIGEG